MGFEVYDRAPAANAPLGPMVNAFGDDGAVARGLTLTGAAVKLLGRPDRVELLFDPSTQRLGVRGCSEDSRRAFVLLANRSSDWPWIVDGAGEFLRRYQVVTGRYAAAMHEGILCANVAALDGSHL